MQRQSGQASRVRKLKGAKAWLVTWGWHGDDASRKEKIAAILSPRRSGKWMRDFVEALYINDPEMFTLSERLALALDRKGSPYHIIERDHDPPYQERATWKNRPRPRIST